MFATKHAYLLAGGALLAAFALPAAAGDFSFSFRYGDGWHYRGRCAPTRYYSVRSYTPVVYRDDDCGIVYDTDVIPGRYYVDYAPRPAAVYSDYYAPRPAVVYSDYGYVSRPAIVYNSYVPAYRHVTRAVERRTVYHTQRRYCAPPPVERRHYSDREVRFRGSYTPLPSHRSYDAPRIHHRDSGPRIHRSHDAPRIQQRNHDASRSHRSHSASRPSSHRPRPTTFGRR